MAWWGGWLQRWQAGVAVEAALASGRHRIDLSELELESLPPALVGARDIRKLFLHCNRLKELPVDLDWPYLNALALDYNRLERLQLRFLQLPSLVYLNISHNPLGQLPESICQLTGLQVLWANSIGVQELPDTLCDLENLETLGLRRNSIARLPQGFKRLVNLCWLTLQDNIIEELPEGLSELNIVHLNVSRNRIREFPPDFQNYKSIQYFKIHHNQIARMPFDDLSNWDLSKMKSLVYIDVRDNPVVDDPVYKDCFKKHVEFKTTNEYPPTKDLEEELADMQAQVESEETTEATEAPAQPARDNQNDGDSDTSFCEDWENSICSLHLNNEEHSDDDLEENEISGINISVISKFTGGAS